MSRLTTAIINNAYGAKNTATVLDISKGGQQGYAPVLGIDENGVTKSNWISNQAYVSRNLICLLLEAPRFFSLLQNSENWIAALKSLMELHTINISGLTAGLTAEFTEHAIGGSNQMQEEISNVTRERSVPVHQVIEKVGLPVYNLLDTWIRAAMDPETKYSALMTDPNIDPRTAGVDMLADWYTATCLYVELDPTHTSVIKSFLCGNMMPKTTGEYVGTRDLTAAREINTIDIEFTAITQVGAGVNRFAQSIIDKINLQKANPYLAKSFVDTISSDVEAADQAGYKENIATLAQNTV